MTIQGASKECVDKLYSIFTSKEIEVSKDDEGLYFVIMTLYQMKYSLLTVVMKEGRQEVFL